jgi:hypothetical protein
LTGKALQEAEAHNETVNLIRKQFAQDTMKLVGSRMAFMAMGLMGGGSTSFDPEDPLFGRLKVGDLVIDPWGGNLWIPRGIAMMIAGDREKAMNYWIKQGTYKINPAVSASMAMWKGKDVTGHELNAIDYTFGFMPIMLQGTAQNIYNMYEGQNIGGESSAQLFLEMLGGSSYIRNKTKKKGSKRYVRQNF